jgi:hypothetical protein
LGRLGPAQKQETGESQATRTATGTAIGPRQECQYFFLHLPLDFDSPGGAAEQYLLNNRGRPTRTGNFRRNLTSLLKALCHFLWKSPHPPNPRIGLQIPALELKRQKYLMRATGASRLSTTNG